MQQIDFWDNIAEKYAASAIGNTQAYEATLTRVRELLSKDMSVLEIGCGTGTTALKLAGSAAMITGTDISSEMIRIANEKMADQAVDAVQFKQAAAGEIVGGPYDAIMAFNLVHLVDDRPGFYAKIYDHLPKGGVFISKTPCLGTRPWFFPLIFAAQLIGKAPKPVASLTPKRLRSELEAAGFEIEEMMHFPGQSISRFVVARKPA